VKALVKIRKIKDKACRKCKRVFSPKVPLQVVCSLKCSIELAKEKTKKKEAKDWKERKIEGLEKLKTIGGYKHEARVFFQQWVRMRDIRDTCISCEIIETKQWDGGHYFKAEIYSGLIFNEDNCHKQCSRCNKELHGNESNYRIGLVKRIGEARVKWLEENKDRLRTYSYEKEELIEIKKKYIYKIKELKNGNSN
jgi:hypothetical protein